MSDMGWARGPRPKRRWRNPEGGSGKPPPRLSRPVRVPRHRLRTALGFVHEIVTGMDPLALLAVATLVVLGLMNLVAIGQTQLAAHQLLSVLAGCALLGILNRSKVRSLGWIARVGTCESNALISQYRQIVT